jgi:hypothetical protein
MDRAQVSRSIGGGGDGSSPGWCVSVCESVGASPQKEQQQHASGGLRVQPHKAAEHAPDPGAALL